MSHHHSTFNQLNLPQLIKQAETLLTELDIAEKHQQVQDLQKQTSQPGFWDQAGAQATMQRLGTLRSELEEIEQAQHLLADLTSFQELMAEAAADSDLADSADDENQQLKQEIKQQGQQLQAKLSELKIKTYLSDPYDQGGAIVSIHPGQGGTEAMDWAEMLERMYLRYFERKAWNYQILSEEKGEEAGIKEASFEVQGAYAYGYLKGERGTHRLVRQSPFNADNLRQTSFALVEVMPVIEQDQDFELKTEDLAWNFTRAGGPGGQSVNKTNSAVELTHEPSGITVKARQSRSQVQNKQTALKMLRSKLAHQQELKRQKQLRQEKGQHVDASWGTQIRNYVLHPYQLVKDTRTKVETSDSEAVLDGELDQFISEQIKLDL
jgi:peptide chain release factor 2